MLEDTGVDRVEDVARAGRRGHVPRLGDLGRADPAVAVPLGPATPQAYAVEHAVAGEEVIVARIGRHRIGADADVASVELGRQRTLDRQVVQRQLLAHRPVDAGQQRMRRIAHRHA